MPKHPNDYEVTTLAKDRVETMVIDVKPNTRHRRPSGAPTRPFTSGLYRHYADNAAIKTVDLCLERWNRSAFASGHPETSSSAGNDVINLSIRCAVI
jgi:hypothetical protein